jgi:hypothetical protein
MPFAVMEPQISCEFLLIYSSCNLNKIQSNPSSYGWVRDELVVEIQLFSGLRSGLFLA